jgi:predicted AAA+ superfamily ATPase
VKEILKKIIVDFIERDLPEIKEREIDLPLNSGKIVSIVGARRTGKTFLLYWLISKLRQEIPSDRIIYINFEDDRLFPASLQTMDMFLQAYYELYPNNKSQKVYFFFDEIQEIKNWELFVRRIYDNENCSLFVTGSSSKLLIKEVSAALRGRNISYEIFPLSFIEYLTLKGIEVRKYSSESLSRIVNAFEQYLSTTAFPELVNMEENLRRKSLKEYLDLVIYKDIVEKYRVSNIHLMKYLIKFVFSNCANLISINNIYNEMKSSGLSISRNTVYEYISYLEDSYTIFSLPLFTRNFREQQRNPKKYYAIDIGLRRAMTISEDKGKLLESIVYFHLRRYNENVFYYLSDQEVDFVLLKGNEFQLLNVCYEMLSAGTKKREINSLLNAMKKMNQKTAYLLTGDEEGEEIIDNKKIKIIPVWKWILDL